MFSSQIQSANRLWRVICVVVDSWNIRELKPKIYGLCLVNSYYAIASKPIPFLSMSGQKSPYMLHIKSDKAVNYFPLFQRLSLCRKLWVLCNVGLRDSFCECKYLPLHNRNSLLLSPCSPHALPKSASEGWGKPQNIFRRCRGEGRKLHCTRVNPCADGTS